MLKPHTQRTKPHKPLTKSINQTDTVKLNDCVAFFGLFLGLIGYLFDWLVAYHKVLSCRLLMV